MPELDWSEVSRAMRERRRMQMPRVCQVCGKEFTGTSWAKYCGVPCQQAAYRAAHREELNQKRREKYHRLKGDDRPNA